jgi:hypothetical protein
LSAEEKQAISRKEMGPITKARTSNRIKAAIEEMELESPGQKITAKKVAERIHMGHQTVKVYWAASKPKKAIKTKKTAILKAKIRKKNLLISPDLSNSSNKKEGLFENETISGPPEVEIPIKESQQTLQFAPDFTGNDSRPGNLTHDEELQEAFKAILERSTLRKEPEQQMRIWTELDWNSEKGEYDIREIELTLAQYDDYMEWCLKRAA